MSDGEPKSALELVMEKLAKQDAESGETAASLTKSQREGISDARRDYDVKVAECRILYDSQRTAVFDPEARRTLDEEYRRDLARFATDRDRKIERITLSIDGSTGR